MRDGIDRKKNPNLRDSFKHLILIGRAKGVDELAEQQNEDRLSHAVGHRRDCPGGHQNNIFTVGECEELVKRFHFFHNLLTERS